MKNYKWSIHFLAAGLVLMLSTMSCKKVLEIDPVGVVISDSAVRNEADLYDLMNSGYFAMAADDYYGGSMQTFNELIADHLDGSTLSGYYQAIYNRNTNIFNSDISNFYGQLSKGIFQGNLILDNINLASPGAKNNLSGQARFMRALCQFDLVRMYAQPYTTATGAANIPGIPLRLVSERQKVVRKSVAEVYAQIISDLKQADTLLPLTNGVYATKWSAKAILARVYFQMNDFENAYLYANEVISNGGFGFDADFTHRYSSAGTPESVFGFIYEVIPTPTSRFQRLHSNYNTLGAALPALRLTSAFYAKATANSTDQRRTWYTTKNGAFLLGKFDSVFFKLPVIHITELKLIRAESAAERNANLDVAIGDINDIMTRAYGTSSSLLLPAGANATLVKETVRRERELELVGEGNWAQELKRRGGKGELITIRGASYNCPGMIFPFPNNEVIHSAPEFIQNPTGGCN